MSVQKIVLKAILTALEAAACLIVFMIAALCLFFPSTMMQVSYNMGLDGMSASFAKTAYDRTNDIYYIAYATEVSIGMNDNANIIHYGELLVDDNEFSQYSKQKNENLPQWDGYQATGSYEQYIYSKICVAMYKRGSDKAVQRAFAFIGIKAEDTALTAFPRQNAVVALLVQAMGNNDAQTITMIKGKFETLQADLSGADQAYYEEVLAFMQRENG